MPATQHHTVCNRDCPDACGILATVEDGRITRLQGDPDHPVTRGFLCYRTGQFLHTQYHPDRLTTPLLRKGGALVPVGWDEALDFVATRLLAIRAESGPAALFHYQSGGSLGALKGLTQRLFDAFGPVTGKVGDICSGAGDAAQDTDFGERDSHDLFDLLHSRHILLWGKNVAVSSPHTAPVLKDAKARGARLVLVDPVHHATAAMTERFIQPRPAGDFALAMAVARLLLDSGRVHPDAAAYCDHLDAFTAMARARSVAEWCADADVPVADAEDLADRLAQGPTAILVGWGMGRRSNGGAIIRALDALGAISGSLGVPGGGVSYYFKRKRAFRKPWDAAEPPRTIHEIRFGADLLAASDPPVRAVWITAGNPVVMLPDSAKVQEALASRELLVVVDSFLTDTARLATVVLPCPTLLEDDDLVGAYGHHWVGASRPVVPPPPGVPSELELLQALAARLGLGGLLDGDARTWKDRFLLPEAKAGGLTVEAMDRGAVRNPLAPPVLFADRRFPTPSGRVNLLTEVPPPPEPSPGRPLWLLSLSTPHSQSSQWALPAEGPAVATVHPDAAPGSRDGDLARLASAIGELTVRLRFDPRQRRDVVIVPKGGHVSAGRCPNVLIQARVTDIGDGGALYDERVSLTPV